MIDKQELGRKVKAWREEKGITQKAVAQISGLSPADVGRIERGGAGEGMTKMLHDLLYSGAHQVSDLQPDSDNRLVMAANLKRLRDMAGLTQGKLARLACVDQQYIGRIEQGSVSKAVQLPSIAAALNVSPEDIDPLFYLKFPSASVAARSEPSHPPSPRVVTTKKSDRDLEEIIPILASLSEKVEERLGFKPTIVQTLQYIAKQVGL